MVSLRTVSMVLLVAVLAVASVGAAGTQYLGSAPAQDSQPTGSAVAGSLQVGPGTPIQVTYSPNVPQPTADQLKEAQALTARSNREGPKSPSVVPAATGPINAPLEVPGKSAPVDTPVGSSAPNSFLVFRDSVIPASGIAGGYQYSSYVMEPSSGVNGKNVFQTGNWYASRSMDNGSTWQYLNPFTLFGSGFCCDQVTLYDADRNVQLWELQFSDHLVLAISSGTDLVNWCYYTVTPSWFGEPSTTAIDYNDIAVSKNYLYVASNLFPSTGGGYAGIARIPIDNMVTCSGLGITYFKDVNFFTFKPVQNAQNDMYWASDWTSSGNGSEFRVYQWNDASNTIFWWDKTVAAFTFMYRNNGQNCASQDGVVNNWCAFNDSRVKGGVAGAAGNLVFAFDAQQDANHPFPFTRLVFFRQNDKAYSGAIDLWGSWGSIDYTTLGVNTRGDLGGSFSFGGGTGTSHWYPGTALLLRDDYGFNVRYQDYGAGNTCLYGGIPRWGDYLTTRPMYPAGYLFLSTGWSIQGGDCGTTGSYSQPDNIVFGRGRDTGSWSRWALK